MSWSTYAMPRRCSFPAEGAPEAAELLDALQEFDRLADAGLTNPSGGSRPGRWLGSGLGAPMLARGLYLAYADAGPRRALDGEGPPGGA